MHVEGRTCLQAEYFTYNDILILVLGYRLEGPNSILGVRGVEIFLHSFVSDWSWDSLHLLLNEYWELSLGVKAAKRRTSHSIFS